MMGSPTMGITLMLLFTVRCGIIDLLLSYCGCALYCTCIICCRCYERDESQVQMLGLVICPKLRCEGSGFICWDPVHMKNLCWVGTTCMCWVVVALYYIKVAHMTCFGCLTIMVFIYVIEIYERWCFAFCLPLNSFAPLYILSVFSLLYFIIVLCATSWDTDKQVDE